MTAVKPVARVCVIYLFHKDMFAVLTTVTGIGISDYGS